jgi:hypothetical protein
VKIQQIPKVSDGEPWVAIGALEPLHFVWPHVAAANLQPTSQCVSADTRGCGIACMPGVEDHRELTMGARAFGEKAHQDLRRAQLPVAVIRAGENLACFVVGDLGEQLLAGRRIPARQNRARVVRQPRFMEMHEVPHDADVDQIRGMHGGFPHAHDPAIVLRLEIVEPVDAAASEEQLGGTRGIRALQCVAQKCFKVQAWLGAQCRCCPAGKGVACVGGALLSAELQRPKNLDCSSEVRASQIVAMRARLTLMSSANRRHRGAGRTARPLLRPTSTGCRINPGQAQVG